MRPARLAHTHIHTHIHTHTHTHILQTAATTPGRLVKEVTTPIKAKASEMKSKIIKLIHPSRSHDTLALTPRKHSSPSLDFTQVCVCVCVCVCVSECV
jgi:hypothetical protein